MYSRKNAVNVGLRLAKRTIIFFSAHYVKRQILKTSHYFQQFYSELALYHEMTSTSVIQFHVSPPPNHTIGTLIMARFGGGGHFVCGLYWSRFGMATRQIKWPQPPNLAIIKVPIVWFKSGMVRHTL